MSEGIYPEKVTEENLEELTERAEKIRDKTLQFRYGFSLALIYVLIAFPVVRGFFYLYSWLGVNGYLNFLLVFSGESLVLAFFILSAVFVLIFSLPILSIVLLSIIWIFRKYLRYPTNEEVIFAESFIIAKHLTNNERDKAKKEVGLLLATFTAFVRNVYFNSKRKVYSPEFDKLRSGKHQIGRMLMFSTEKNIPDLFRNFGLTLIRNDDPEAFSNLNELIKEVEKYGEFKGRMGRFLSGLERYPNSLPWLISFIIIVIGIIYYILSGQRLPTG